MKHILTAYSILLFLIPAYPAFAQDGDAGPGVEETLPQEGTQGPEHSAGEPAIVPEEPYKYYYWPEENLDNFGLSTLGSGARGEHSGAECSAKEQYRCKSAKRVSEKRRGYRRGYGGREWGHGPIPARRNRGRQRRHGNRKGNASGGPERK